MRITRKAHSKLNLFLEVTGKKENGYHELHSLAVFLDLADEITVEPAEIIEVHESGSDSAIENNLVFRTAVLLAEEYNVDRGAKITFTKKIPIGGGLGGGSADAAATLVLLNTFWKLNIPREHMFEIALELGADVPVCLYSILENKNAAIFKGIGEVIEPAPEIPHLHFLLVNPGKELPTQNVFKKYKYKKLPSPAFHSDNFFETLAARRNDLEEPAKKLMPEIDTIIKEIATQKNCLLARMTGSGATCFGIFKSSRDAREAAKAIMSKHPDWRVGPTNLKRTSLLSIYEKAKRPLIKAKVRFYKKTRVYLADSIHFQKFIRKLESRNISFLRFRSASKAVVIHLLALLLSLIVFTQKEFAPEPRLIHITFSNQQDAEVLASLPNIPYDTAVIGANAAASPDYAPLTDLKLATDAAVAARVKAQELAAPVPEKPVKEQKETVKQKREEAKPEPKTEEVVKEKTSKNKKGAKYGNTEELAQLEAADYLELLQYTVQEMSQIPKEVKGLKGIAILRLEFDRKGFVHSYNLRQKTGVYVLDEAALNVAKKLMEQPFPAAPKEFDKGEQLLKYDFMIKYPPEG